VISCDVSSILILRLINVATSDSQCHTTQVEVTKKNVLLSHIVMLETSLAPFHGCGSMVSDGGVASNVNTSIARRIDQDCHEIVEHEVISHVKRVNSHLR